jgi:hypothetical protein
MNKLGNWLHGLVAPCIGGGAMCVSGWLIMVATKAVGLDVPTLNLKALGIIFIFAALTNALSYRYGVDRQKHG